MNLNNIHNQGRVVYLFCRDSQGKLEIKTDNSFFPYYFSESPDGTFKTYNGLVVKKLFATKPSEVSKLRNNRSWEADIIFTRRYLIDKVKEINKVPLKYAFVDIEILADEMPDVTEAKFPVACISVYNSLYKTVQSFFLPDYETEYEMLEAFIKYMRTESFDLWLSWNVNFDYDYLYNRVPDFSTKISIINQQRYGHDEISYPAGISVCDYLSWFKKVTLNKAKSYALNAISHEYLGKEKTFKKVDFSQLSDEILQRNREDVEIMAKLEAKFKIIPYFNEIRRLSKVEWEDLLWNSRIIDMLLLQEAKEQKVILPMKPVDNEKEDFEGAYREAYKIGALRNIGKYDLASAYPNMIVDFCLDPSNIDVEFDIQAKEAIQIENTLFVQNPNALLPTVTKKLILLKDKIKHELESLDLNSEEYKDIKIKYNAIKSVVNSAYGVMGNRFFRLYDNRIASATTFLVRDLLHYVKDELEAKGYPVVYVDTDSVFIASENNLTEFLNAIIAEWAITKYDKEEITTRFSYEGIYEKILILAKCRYKGWLKSDKGGEIEIKGIEEKRKDSTKFMVKFQADLIEKIVNQEPKEQTISWIKSEIERIKTVPLNEVAFPCKLARNEEDYKNKPIFVRAVEETEGFAPKMGEEFFYIYVEPEAYEVEKEVTEYYREVAGKREGTTKKEKLTNKEIQEIQNKDFESKKVVYSVEVLVEKGIIKQEDKIKKEKKFRDVKAFNEESDTSSFKVDWQKMIARNILNKCEVIFEAIGWKMEELND